MNTKRYINININYNNIPPYIIIYIIISIFNIIDLSSLDVIHSFVFCYLNNNINILLFILYKYLLPLLLAFITLFNSLSKLVFNGSIILVVLDSILYYYIYLYRFNIININLFIIIGFIVLDVFIVLYYYIHYYYGLSFLYVFVVIIILHILFNTTITFITYYCFMMLLHLLIGFIGYIYGSFIARVWKHLYYSFIRFLLLFISYVYCHSAVIHAIFF